MVIKFIYICLTKLTNMKKTVFYIASLALVVAGISACGGATEEQTEATPVTYVLDEAASSLKWQGDYADGSHNHHGTVKIQEGSVKYNGDTFEAGSFSVDMKSIESELTPETGSEKLIGHLGAEDFFNIAQFPSVDVTINSITDTEIDATLKVVGRDVPAKMPVKITRTGDKLTASGKFSVDFSTLELNGFKPNPEMEKEKPNQFVKPEIQFELNLVMKAEKAEAAE